MKERFAGVLLYNFDPYISSVARTLEGELEGKIPFVIISAGNDQLTQNEQLEDLIARGVSVLVVNIVDLQAGPLIADRAKRESIPVIFFNREPELSAIKSYDKARYIGTRHIEAGVMQGEIIADLWKNHPEYDLNSDGKFQYMMIQANPDHPEAIARTEYSVRTARERGVQLTQVGDTLLCDWDYDQARQAAGLAFASSFDQLELIIANNDSMALGAISALQERGYNLGDPKKFIPVVGVDAIPEAVEAIQLGRMSGTVRQDGELMGKTIAAFLLNALEGRDFLEGTGREWDESGIAVRLPYTRLE